MVKRVSRHWCGELSRIIGKCQRLKWKVWHHQPLACRKLLLVRYREDKLLIPTCMWPSWCLEKRRIRRLSVVPNVRAGIKVMVAFARCSALLTIIRLKRKSVAWSHWAWSALCELGIFWFCRAKGICGWHSNPAWRSSAGEEVFLSGLGRWDYRLSITPNRADALSMRGWPAAATIYDKLVQFKRFPASWKWKAGSWQSIGGSWNWQSPYYAACILEMSLCPRSSVAAKSLMNEGPSD